jgi:hypothetical protein
MHIWTVSQDYYCDYIQNYSYFRPNSLYWSCEKLFIPDAQQQVRLDLYKSTTYTLEKIHHFYTVT